MLAVADRTSEPTGTLETALAHARRLLDRDPVLAEAQANAILDAVPGHPEARRLLGSALRRRGDLVGARRLLQALAREQPRSALTQYEFGLVLSASGEGAESVLAYRRAVELKPDLSEAWRALADQLFLAGDWAQADLAYAQHIRASIHDPVLMEAAVALCDERLAVAERLLRDHLKRHPTDVAAIRMLAEVAARLGRFADAELLLERCLELAPGFLAARHNYAIVLNRQNKGEAVVAEVDRLLAAEPTNPAFRNLKASALAQIGEYAGAIDLYEGVLAEHADQPKIWLSYGHALKTAGRTAESIAAYDRSLVLSPEFGEAWWSLANLKTYRFSDLQISAMRAQLDRPDLTEDDRLHLEFALGKALEDAEAWAESFAHYANGARIRRAQIGYRASDMTLHVERCETLLTGDFFDARRGSGSAAPDPIFVVGLPRSGSTLVEQILASHSAVEGTQELPEIVAISRALGAKGGVGPASTYLDALAALGPDALAELGEQYLQRTRVHRKTDKPFFIDKLPNNFAHIGLIKLILPNAKIIDVRRHPMAACFSGFKQHFARGQHFSYDLGEIGQYYCDYVALLAHFDGVLKGQIHRVIYENMVADTEGEVRRLLDYCGLPFEDGCLRFYESGRAVRTASSEQVRRPIFSDAVDHWRRYAPWLGPLEAALGPILSSYPRVPEREAMLRHRAADTPLA